MRWICVWIACALLTTPAWAKSRELSTAVDLYESGQLHPARDQLRLLVDKRHLSSRDRIQARLYLAATELSLQEPKAAREQLTILAQRHPTVRPDPSVFSPELVVLSDQIRQEVAEQRGPRKPRPDDRAEAKKQQEAQRQAALTRQAELKKRQEAERAALAQQQEAQRQEELRKREEAARQAEAKRAAVAERPVAPDLLPSATVTSGPLDSLPQDHSGHPTRRTWGYVALGVGGAAAIVGALCGSAARSAANDVAAARTSPDWSAAKARVDSNASKATGSFVLAGLALTGGAVMVATSF